MYAKGTAQTLWVSRGLLALGEEEAIDVDTFADVAVAWEIWTDGQLQLQLHRTTPAFNQTSTSSRTTPSQPPNDPQNPLPLHPRIRTAQPLPPCPSAAGTFANRPPALTTLLGPHTPLATFPRNASSAAGRQILISGSAKPAALTKHVTGGTR
ncbi:hypothetical protein LTR39_000727 [Cryomyces antarcticus]|nr:hypothetical protein LTR39_000727 [Cryomyces antarcticus]